MNKIVDFSSLSVVFVAAILVLSFNLESHSAIKVYPRLITPGTSADNGNAFFDFEIFDEPKPELKIFDITGRQVKSTQILNPSATSTGWRFVWNGKDDSGNLVSPGVYIYQWREGTATTTGSIVVAR